MIKKILNVNGAKVLTKAAQFGVLGGTFSSCVKIVAESGIYLECYHIERQSYVILNMLGAEVDCDEVYDH